MATSINTGSQTVYQHYKFNLNGDLLTDRLSGVVSPGVYSGLTLSYASTTSVTVAAGIVEIGDGVSQARIKFGASFVVTVAEATPYVVLRWNYVADPSVIYAEVLTLAYASIQANDVVLGKPVFAGGIVTSTMDYLLKTVPATVAWNARAFALKVTSAQPPSSSIVVSTGKVITNAGYVTVTGGSYVTGTAPSVNPRFDLVLLTKTGSVVFEKGSEAASPVVPNFKNRAVIAYIRRTVGVAIIYNNDITLVDYDRFTSMDDWWLVDDAYLEGGLVVNNNQVTGKNFTVKGVSDPSMINTNAATGRIGIGMLGSAVSAARKLGITGPFEVIGSGDVSSKLNVGTSYRIGGYANTEMTRVANCGTETVFGSDGSGIKVYGGLTAYRTYNPKYMDIAETFPKGKDVKLVPGMTLSFSSEFRGAIPFSGHNYLGIYSDTYGHLLGTLSEDRVPIALKGQVLVNVAVDHPIYSGAYLIPSAPGTVRVVTHQEYLDSPFKVGLATFVDEADIIEFFDPKLLGLNTPYRRVMVWLV